MNSQVSKSEEALYQKLKDKIKIAFDVGCHRDIIFPNAEQLHLFDPRKDKISEEMIRRTENMPNVYFNNIGLGEVPGKVKYHYGYGSIMKRINSKFTNHSSYEIEITSISEYCRDKGINHIDFLKIDTEGYDFEVIKGIGSVNVDYIQFEDFRVFAGGETTQDVIRYLENNGYAVSALGGNPLNYLAINQK